MTANKGKELPVAWMNAYGLFSSIPGGGYDIPLYPRPEASIEQELQRVKDELAIAEEVNTELNLELHKAWKDLEKRGTKSTQPAAQIIPEGSSVKQIPNEHCSLFVHYSSPCAQAARCLAVESIKQDAYNDSVPPIWETLAEIGKGLDRTPIEQDKRSPAQQMAPLVSRGAGNAEADSPDLNPACESAPSVKIPEFNSVVAGVQVAHTDHPMRHWDRTCPACAVESIEQDARRWNQLMRTPRLRVIEILQRVEIAERHKPASPYTLAEEMDAALQEKQK